jgi:polar amino acid transport system substrate-binding protein
MGNENTPSPTATESIQPTATRATGERVDPNQTAIPPLVTQSALVDIRERGLLRVGVLYNYPPFGFLTHDGQVQGYEVELARRIAERWGVAVEFVQVTRQTRLQMLYEGQIDVIAAAMPHRRELEALVEFSETTFRSGFVALVTTASGIEAASQIADGTVGVTGIESQAVMADYASRAGLAPTIQVYDSLRAAEADLQTGTLRALVGRREDMILASSAVPDSRILDDFILVEPYAFATRRGDTPLRDLLNLTLQALAAEGGLGELFTANFFGYAADLFPTLPGDPLYDFSTFPADIPLTESVVDRIRRGEPIRVAGMSLTSEPRPFDSQPIIDGYNRAVINEMARRWNIPVVESPDSAGAAGLAQLQAGQTDLAVGIRPEKSLIGVVAFSQPYYSRGIRLIHMDDVTVYGVGELELRPSLAAPPVDVSEDIIRDNNYAPDVRTTESFEDAFAALTSRAVYAVVGDEYALVLMAQADERIRIVDQRYRSTNFVMALGRFDPRFLSLVNFTLQDMALDGTLERLRQQYFGPYLPPGETLDPFQIEVWPGDGSFLEIGQ